MVGIGENQIWRRISYVRIHALPDRFGSKIAILLYFWLKRLNFMKKMTRQRFSKSHNRLNEVFILLSFQEHLFLIWFSIKMTIFTLSAYFIMNFLIVDVWLIKMSQHSCKSCTFNYERTCKVKKNMTSRSKILSKMSVIILLDSF